MKNATKVFLISILILTIFPFFVLADKRSMCNNTGGTYTTVGDMCDCPSGKQWSVTDGCVGGTSGGTTAQQQAKNNCENTPGGSYNVDTGVCTCASGWHVSGMGCDVGGSGGSSVTGPVTPSGGGGTTGGGTTGGGGGTTGGGSNAGAEPGAVSSVEIPNPLKWKDFGELINAVINFLFYLGLVVVPLTIVIAGLFMMSAGGEPEKVTQAKRIIWYSAIGLFIILFAKGLISILNGILGVK